MRRVCPLFSFFFYRSKNRNSCLLSSSQCYRYTYNFVVVKSTPGAVPLAFVTASQRRTPPPVRVYSSARCARYTDDDILGKRTRRDPLVPLVLRFFQGVISAISHAVTSSMMNRMKLHSRAENVDQPG